MSINTIATSPQSLFFLLERGYNRREAIFLWGKPGIGKSSIVREWVESHQDWDLHDVRLTTMEPCDLRGLPSIDANKKRTMWNLPEFIPEEDSDRAGVIFLDELTAADSRMQASAYELINERCIGGKPIPKNYWVIAAGNSTEDGAISFDMGTALADRFLHLRVTADPDSWLKWAAANDIHPAVQSFIKVKGDTLETNEQAQQSKHIITPTPRSWHKVSDILKQELDSSLSEQVQTALIRAEVYGRLGDSIGANFFSVMDEISSLPDIPTLLKAKAKDQKDMVPDSINSFYGLTYSVLAYVVDPKTADKAIKLFHNLCSVKDTVVPRDEIKSLLVEHIFEKAVANRFFKDLIKLDSYKEYTKEMESFTD